MSAPPVPVKRSLILAGGGNKVAFQAGVLQVWLDEVPGLRFDHLDAASGGALNLAMYLAAGGRETPRIGTRIADFWRNLRPLDGVSVNWHEWMKPGFGASLLTLDRFRARVLPSWGLDAAGWRRVRESKEEATFNAFNFSRQHLEVFVPAQMTEDHLIACVSLPMWFPPVTIDGDAFVDAVFATDANLEVAIEHGATEIWVIWTVSELGAWRNGFVADYFQMVEQSANGTFRQMCERIRRNNAALANGQPSEFGRHIDLKILRAEVPLNYLFNLGGDRVAEAVNRGVVAARQWCAGNDWPVQPRPEVPEIDGTTMWFSETMRGFIGLGEIDYASGLREGRRERTALKACLTVRPPAIKPFVRSVAHCARVTGYLECDVLGGRLPVLAGQMNVLVDADSGPPPHNPDRKQMRYRLVFRDLAGRLLTLVGTKEVRNKPGYGVWRETTLLYTRILSGNVTLEDDAQAEVVASGIIEVHALDFLRQLTTFRASGPTLASRVGAIGRYGAFFAGHLWDVYAQNVLTYSPF